MKTKTIINILMASMTFLLLAIFLLKIKFVCIFKMVFNISCPSCGLTRSFYYLLDFDLINSIKSNILGVPLFISIIVIYIIYFIDKIKKSNSLEKLYLIFVNKFYYFLIILFVSWIINIIL